MTQRPSPPPMGAPVVVAAFDADELRRRLRRTGRLKGRQADEASLAESDRCSASGRPAAGRATG